MAKTKYHCWNPGLGVQQCFHFRAFNYMCFAVNPVAGLLDIRPAMFVVETMILDSIFIVTDCADLVELVLCNKASRARTFAEIANSCE
jgi:hypothetical protein